MILERHFKMIRWGTFNVLEQCRKHNTKIVFMSTCMVYDRATDENGITEEHPVKPASPYAGSKIPGENMVLSYWYAYKLPAVVIRPFNTYRPMQKSSGEGGVVAIFIKRNLEGLSLNIYVMVSRPGICFMLRTVRILL